jgi:uncharacterized membrane protein YphA (DoxX/SURF4 family)
MAENSQSRMEANLTNHWSPIRKAVFRFVFLYFLIYGFPFPFDALGWMEKLVQPYFTFLDFIITGIGTRLFHFPVHTAFGSFDKLDDSYYGLTFLLTDLILSAVGTLIWSWLDRHRSNYIRLNEWFRLYLRYFLAISLIVYGFDKLFPSQFQEVTASRLVMEVGEQTPMLLAWNFMGYSVAFTVIIGSIEILAGTLLFFRRTTTLGSLLGAITFSFVTLLDYCFNVPVKLFSSHLLLISLVLLIGDRKRLVAVLLLNKPVGALTYPRLFKKESWNKGFALIQALFIVAVIYQTVDNSFHNAKLYGRYAPRVPYYGIYETNLFIRNKDTIPALDTDSLRWKQLVIDGGSWKQYGVIKFSNDRKAFYNIKTDTINHIFRIQSLSDTLSIYTLHFANLNENGLAIEGKWKEDSIKVIMTRRNLDSVALKIDRFHLVGE